MTLSIKDLFQRALRDGRKILRPVFFSAETPTLLVPEATESCTRRTDRSILTMSTSCWPSS